MKLRIRKIFRPLIFISLVLASSFPVCAKQISQLSEQRQALINCAIELLGTPYQWGGKTPSPGIDCSGFVAYVSRKAIQVNFTGISQVMYNATTKIEDNQKEPGDLLFFSNTYSSNKITHVGIYLGLYTGEGKLHGKHIFIHCASDEPETGVIVSSIDDENFWTRHYIGAGRYLPSTKEAEKIIQELGVEKGREALKSSPEEFSKDPWWSGIDKSWFEK